MRATPEETIRQRVIRNMIAELGYPRGLIAVEKDLVSLCIGRKAYSSDPNRRVDILCYVPGAGGLRPLLLIECKADRWGPLAENQVLGYNSAIGAPFIALAGGLEVKTLWREKDKIVSVPFLPCFADLVGQL